MPTPLRSNDSIRHWWARRKLLGPLVVVGGVLLLGGIFIGWPYFTTQQFEQSSKLYEDRERGFSFRYPKAWELIPKQDLKDRNEKFVTGVYLAKVPSMAVGVIVEPRQEGVSYEPKALAQEVEQELATKLKDFKKLRTQGVSRQGHSGVEIHYTYKHLDKTYVNQRQLILVTDQRVYYLAGTSLLQDYQTYRKDLEQTFRSFRVD